MSFSDVASQFRKSKEAKASQPARQADPVEVEALRGRIVGVLIRDARLAKGYAVEQLAGMMRVSQDEIVTWEFGQATPSLPQLELLAYWLEVPVSHFISGTQTLLDQSASRRIDQHEYRQIRDHMIGAEVRALRESAGFTLDYLAAQTGLSIELLNAYEFGAAPIPLSHLTTLASVLRVTVASFLEGNDRVGSFLQAQELFGTFLKMEPELRQFVAKPSSHPYLELARKLAEMDSQKLRQIAEDLLEITL